MAVNMRAGCGTNMYPPPIVYTNSHISSTHDTWAVITPHAAAITPADRSPLRDNIAYTDRYAPNHAQINTIQLAVRHTAAIKNTASNIAICTSSKLAKAWLPSACFGCHHIRHMAYSAAAATWVTMRGATAITITTLTPISNAGIRSKT